VNWWGEPSWLASRTVTGYSIIDLLFAMAVMLIVAAIAVPQALTLVQRPRAQAAARYLASAMTRAHTEAVMRSATTALRFQEQDGGFVISEFVDGNRNGVRTRDIDNGVDLPLRDPIRLSDLFPNVALALSEDGAGGDPVQIGATTLMSFTPLGTATSGTIYLRGADGSQFAVRVLGATGRTRVLRYEPASRDWVEVL
jgi:type II secretory pathway pseudopilin PulG